MAGTLNLVRRARDGDREAWGVLYERYIDRFLSRYHGDLGTTIQRLGSTRDFVQSAFREAMLRIGDLRNESAFFVWITTILRHKISAARRLALHERKAHPERVRLEDANRGFTREDVEEYESVLAAILGIFPAHPQQMATVTLRYLDGWDMTTVIDHLERPESTVYRWLKEGLELLRDRLRA
ncbi:MAG: sigma-70 family RNA polymerase sigma factor [Planctomycetes bacterium]|nr:sigma-70 family RNA polymerase sigma factor [Planctomycetota bacterium]